VDAVTRILWLVETAEELNDLTTISRVFLSRSELSMLRSDSHGDHYLQETILGPLAQGLNPRGVVTTVMTNVREVILQRPCRSHHLVKG
jgi:hypothetical protein